MTRAIVIKAHGDPAIAGAIVDGITKNITPLNEDEHAALRAELARLRAKNGVRAYGNSVRYSTACKALAAKYETRPHGRAYRALLGAYGLMWLFVSEWFRYFSDWNRGQLHGR